MIVFGRRGRRTQRVLIAALAGAVALALAACSSGTSSGSPSGSSSGKPLTQVNYQLSWLKITQFGGFFSAQKQGYFTKEGLAPTFTAGGTNILAWQQVASGKDLVGDEDNTLLLQAIAKGEPLVVIGAVFQKSPLSIMSLPKDPITTASQLVGKTIAYPDAAIDQLKAALKTDGVDASKIKIVPAGADPTQLVTGQVAGYGGYSTAQGASLELQGLKPTYLYLDSLGVHGYGNVIITTKQNLKSHRAEIVKFMKASVEGYEWMNANPAAAAEVVVNDANPNGGLKVATETATAKIQKSLITSPTGVLRVDVAKMQGIIDELYASGTITKKLDAATIVDTSVLDDVYGSKTSLLGN